MHSMKRWAVELVLAVVVVGFVAFIAVNSPGRNDPPQYQKTSLVGAYHQPPRGAGAHSNSHP